MLRLYRPTSGSGIYNRSSWLSALFSLHTSARAGGCISGCLLEFKWLLFAWKAGAVIMCISFLMHTSKFRSGDPHSLSWELLCMMLSVPKPLTWPARLRAMVQSVQSLTIFDAGLNWRFLTISPADSTRLQIVKGWRLLAAPKHHDGSRKNQQKNVSREFWSRVNVDKHRLGRIESLFPDCSICKSTGQLCRVTKLCLTTVNVSGSTADHDS